MRKKNRYSVIKNQPFGIPLDRLNYYLKSGMLLNGILSLAVFSVIWFIYIAAILLLLSPMDTMQLKTHVQYSNIFGMWISWKDFFFKITTSFTKSGIRNYRYSIKLKIQQLQVYALRKDSNCWKINLIWLHENKL